MNVRNVALLMLVVIGVICADHASGSTAPAAGRDGPNLGAGALRAAGGHLAFVWRKALYVVDARSGRMHRVGAPGAIQEMRWSSDASFLEYRVADTVWVVRADGSRAHAVPRSCPPQFALCNAARSPSGSTYAYVKSPPYPGDARSSTWSDELYTLQTSERAARLRYVARGAGMRLAGWLEGDAGVLFWLDPLHSGSLAADGLPLMALSFGRSPRTLTTMLPYPEWIAWSPSRDRLLAIAGGPRTAWHGKSLMLCDLKRVLCRAPLDRAGSVALDPAWSPKEEKIAFVRAQDLGGGWGFNTSQNLADWVITRTLWTADADGTHARHIDAAGTGVYRPAWSKDGNQLVYVRGNALWSLEPDGRTPQRILGPFPDPPRPMGEGGMYGYVFWSAVYAWTPR